MTKARIKSISQYSSCVFPDHSIPIDNYSALCVLSALNHALNILGANSGDKYDAASFDGDVYLENWVS
jgi:hypothetical protein